MENDNLEQMQNLFLALADKTRLRLLAFMRRGPVSVGYLAEQLGDSQPKISRHLAYLRNAGIVTTERDGKWIYYGVRKQPNVAADHILGEAIRLIGSGKKAIAEENEHIVDQKTFERSVTYAKRDMKAMSEGFEVSENDDNRTPESEIDIFLL